MPNVGVVAAIDRTWEAGEKGPRPHLGASVVGKPCDRMLVYSFRHAARKPFKGRMLRLFNRGHKEEHRICADLRAIGMEVREYAQRLVWHDLSATYGALEWEEIAGLQNGTLVDVTQHPEHVACAELAGVRLRQWSFSDVGGHHAGSTDGKARIPPTCIQDFDPALPRNAWFATEFKTYNAKSFEVLRTKDSVRATKPEHYTQMQEYMHYMGLPCCLYLAVCKDNDEMYEEVVPYDEAEALRAIERARMAIAARQLPPRISNNATNFGCKFCDYKAKCHFGEPLLQGCRSCADAVAVVDRPGAVWYCSRWASDIPKNAIPAGCPSWRPITD